MKIKQQFNNYWASIRCQMIEVYVDTYIYVYMTRLDTQSQLKMSYAKKKNAFNIPNLLIILA